MNDIYDENTLMNMEYQEPVADDKSGKTPLVLFLSLLFVSGGLSFFAPEDISSGYLWLCMILVFSIAGVLCVHKFKSRQSNWFSVEIMFAMMFFLVHFWYAFSWLLGINPDEIEIWWDRSVVCYAAMMSVSGLAAFMAGFCCLPEHYASPQKSWFDNPGYLLAWRRVGYVLLCGAAIVIVIYVRLLGAELFGGEYGGSDVGGFGARVLYLLLNILLIISIIVLTISSAKLTGKWKVGLVAKAVIAVFLTNVLLLGDRSNVFAYVILIGAGYSEYVRRINLKVFVTGIILGIFVMSIAGIARTSPERTLKSFVKTAFERKEDISIEKGASHLSVSVRTLHAAVSSVPSSHNYFLGKLKVSEFAGIIPFSRRLIRIERPEYTNSSKFLTWTINGHFNWGVGSTIVADVYLDFGYPGVVIVLFLLGLMSKWIQQKARASGTLITGVVHCCLISTMATIPRYTVSFVIRGVLWPLIIVWLLSFLANPYKTNDDYLETEYNK